MKKIKKLEFIRLFAEKQRKILGGTYCEEPWSNYGNPECCKEEYFAGRGLDDVDRDDNDNGDDSGGGNSSCNCFCMPGDNANWGSWFGTKLS